ncbi:class I SAM-dependent methyltransferase [Chloroflexota bacterium]
MLVETSCEICGENHWQVLHHKTFYKSEIRESTIYKQKRLHVLFDKWFPNSQSVSLKYVLCENCGFILYLPRPEEQDIISKYKYLAELIKVKKSIPMELNPHDIKRSDNLFRFLEKKIDLGRVFRILDFGGGDGRLMRAFEKRGKQCYLVDFSPSFDRHIIKLSNTINDLDQEEKFDLLICSHVMEHVSQPLQTLKRLVSHLNEEGWIFIEVPLEIWKHPPSQTEPVTHINFFTPNSLYNLMILSGLNVKSCELASYLHQSGNEFTGVRAIAWKGIHNKNSQCRRLRIPDAKKFLKPKFLLILKYHFCSPMRIPKVILRKIINILNRIFLV